MMMRSIFMFGFIMRQTIHNHLNQALNRNRSQRPQISKASIKAAAGLLMAHRAMYSAKVDLAYYSSIKM